jgi:gamma-glutamylcyclotransferase (GGCT)/AIG2-like uncharacterized protein YtfP
MTTFNASGGPQILHFGYGSNLDLQDWTAFCRANGFDPECLEPVGRAALPDHELVFDYYSPSRGGGALNVRPKVGQVVDGYLFRVAAEGWRALDRKEGVKAGCYERFETVALLPDGSQVPVRTYRACKHQLKPFQRPTAEYLEICRRGRERFGLGTEMLDAVAEGCEADAEVLAVFAYGSLVRGGDRFPIVEEFGVKCALMAHALGDLYDCGAWPALALRPNGDEFQRVAGDFLVPHDLAGLLERLDRIEGFRGFGGEQHLFRRTLIDVDVDHGRPRRAWVYVMDRAPAGARLIEGGDWRRYQRVHTQFVRALVAEHADGVEAFATHVARSIVPPCVEFSPARDDLTMEQLVDAVLSGEVAERRLAQVSERWAAVPAVIGLGRGAVQ